MSSNTLHPRRNPRGTGSPGCGDPGRADRYAGRRATPLPEAPHDAADDLGERGARASLPRVEAEVRSVTALTVRGTTPAECDQHARSTQSRSHLTAKCRSWPLSSGAEPGAEPGSGAGERSRPRR
ncbi:hypothetical protein GCM10010282_67400 [Streptomyces roseolus]|nr:hypothetical protein GCM10010282_67400 [Streptomyces roseolus]